jgi:hypothetical protein
MSQYIEMPAGIRPTLPVSRPAVTTLAGDVLALLAFVVTGLHSHGMRAWEMPVHTLETLAPFLIAWAVVAPLAGVYHRETLTRYRLTVPLVTLAWVVAAVLGTQLRATAYFPGDAPLVFVLVSIAVGTLCLLAVRTATVYRYRSENPQ